MASRYWVGGSGTWSSTNTTNWSATSGGSGGASVPTSADDVFFNASSGNGTVTLSFSGYSFNKAIIKDFNTTGYTGTISCPAGHLIQARGNVTIGSSGDLSTVRLDMNTTSSTSVTLSSSQTLSRLYLIPSGTITVNSNIATSSLGGVSPGASGTVNANTRTFTATAGLLLVQGSGNCDIGTLVSVNPHINVSGASGITTTIGIISVSSYSQIQNTGGGTLSINGISCTGGGAGYSVSQSGTGTTTIGSVGGNINQVLVSRTAGTLNHPLNASLTTVGGAFSTTGFNFNSVSFAGYSNSVSITDATVQSMTLPSVDGSINRTTITMNGTASIANLTWNFTLTNQQAELLLATNVNIGAINLSGNATRKIQVTGQSMQRKLNVTNAVTLSDITWQNIDADGLIPFSGLGFVDNGNNLDITFPSLGSGLFFGSNF